MTEHDPNMTLAIVLQAYYIGRMKQLNLREANQGFSRLVREIERTGERVVVLRNGKPAVEIIPSGERRAVQRRTPEQERAISRISQIGAHNARRLLG